MGGDKGVGWQGQEAAKPQGGDNQSGQGQECTMTGWPRAARGCQGGKVGCARWVGRGICDWRRGQGGEAGAARLPVPCAGGHMPYGPRNVFL